MTTTYVRVTRPPGATKPTGWLNRYFYFFMSLLIAVTIIYGFSHTIDQNLIHAKPARPWILALHAAVFSSWVVFLILQSALIRTRNVHLHRKVGWFGVALGVVIPVLGISTAIGMDRFRIFQLNDQTAAPFLIVQFCDITCFTVAFILAIYWRKKPEFHRRLILVASCALTAAAFGRFPEYLLPYPWFYAGVDLLIFLGVVRDLIVTRRVHAVYRYALPAMILAQTFAIHLLITNSPSWVKIANRILR